MIRLASVCGVLGATVLSGLINAGAVAQPLLAAHSDHRPGTEPDQESRWERGAGAQAPALVPESGRFESIEDALAHYRGLVLEYRWPPIVATSSLRLGDSDPVVADIRTRLMLLGDLQTRASPADAWLFDAPLQAALERFQRRHGLEPDGIFGRRSRAALEVPPRARYQQLQLNQTRLAQFDTQRAGAHTYVVVNIPAFEMRYVEAGKPVLKMRAIVGKLEARTPLVASQIDSLELNPDWNVPSGIAYRDIVPEMQESPDALYSKGLELVVGYGAGMRTLPLSELDYERLYRGPQPQQRFWQAPGPSNPLGLLKFNFPNPYLVYMHGTPSAGLFNRPVRDFSSGCIRIEDPDRLARRLFGLSGGERGLASVSRLEREIAKGKNRVLSLPSPVPVYTTYWTAWLDDDGQVQFREDLYGHDMEADKAVSVTQQSRIAAP
ncbi:L,D-transpeptidase family protein [Marinobacterium rhizophilum]|uniref:L,D-transpeptidase family protein n=1 Tax=Marinobacterium rhizophilum TaxID=420402 RepID=A0ABY5HM43_9GAMM|nr:L,D-transpeptidase family protein [Marinobacterium rhizophilum]UTW13328.1 L,D-transpeptidase family protein [Marinobacterium rhizophilum]